MAGTKIDWREGSYIVADDPILLFIEGDGIGPDVWRAAKTVFDAAVEKVSDGKRKVVWQEILAGERAYEATGEWLPEATLDAIREHRIAIKGPLTTPVGGGMRSLNVALRQILELYACVRPVRHLAGVPSPMKEPDKLDVVIFRENLEDVYAGIEYQAGTAEARKVRDFLVESLGANILEESAIGIKPMSEFNSKKLVAKAIRYAVDDGRPSVTLVHKGNIMKFTEGAFRDWGYEVAEEAFADLVVRERDSDGSGDRVVIKDRIADAMFQQLLLLLQA